MQKYINKIKYLFTGRFPVIAVPYLWLALFFLLPFLIVLKISVAEMETTAISPLLSYVEGKLNVKINFSNFMSLFNDEDQYYLWTYLRSIVFAAVTTLLCLMIGYPFAYFMARSPIERRPALLMLVMLPFWTSFLLRIYAWKGILETNGLLNNFLLWLGVINEPLHMMHTKFSLILGMVYTYLPFMILPLYSNLVKLDNRFLEASADLGATPLQTFWRITIPLSKAGIIAGSMLVFIPCIGEFVIPELLGGPETLMIGRVLWDEFFSNNDWPRASAVAVVMILLIIVPLAIFNKYEAEQMGSKKR
jgi:putrescine transport system permease protein